MSVSPLTAHDAAAYLHRLGVEPGPPSVAQLFAIHRAQVERIPYETTWIHLGETWTVDPQAAVTRILDHRRGGYCFHLNGALGAVLRALGYHVTTHAAGVQGTTDPEPGTVGDHAALVVSGLGDGGHGWLVDAGLGDGLHEPLPLVPGSYRQGPFTFTIAHDGGTWHLRHDRRGSFAGVAFGPPPDDVWAVFAARHAYLSTSPDSGFVRAVTAQRRDGDGADILRALTLSRIRVDGDDKRLVDDRADWFALLADVYGLHLGDTSAASRDRLWAHANEAHEAHLARTVLTNAPSAGTTER